MLSPERLRSRGGARATRRGAMHAAARQHSLAQRVSGRMTKGRGKLGVLHEVPRYLTWMPVCWHFIALSDAAVQSKFC